VWSSAYIQGKNFLAGLVCSQTVIRSIDYGICAETSKATVIFVLHSLIYSNDYIFLNKLAKSGLKIADTRYMRVRARTQWELD
jgi:hypothetical protein